MAIHRDDVPELVRGYTRKEKYSKIRDFYCDLVFALKVNFGLDNFFLIISGDDEQIGMPEAYLKFADYLADNYSEENIQRAIAFYWVALDFDKRLLREHQEDTVAILKFLKSEHDRLISAYAHASAETAWLAIVDGKADSLLRTLMQGKGGHSYNQFLRHGDIQREPVSNFDDFAHYALYQILRYRSLRVSNK